MSNPLFPGDDHDWNDGDTFELKGVSYENGQTCVRCGQHYNPLITVMDGLTMAVIKGSTLKFILPCDIGMVRKVIDE